MKRNLPFALSVLLCLAILAGCHTTYVRPDGSLVPPAEAALIRANDSVDTAYALIGDARDAGVITQTDIDKNAAVFNAIDTALDSASASLRAGDEAGVKRWTDAARAALERLQPLLTKAKTR